MIFPRIDYPFRKPLMFFAKDDGDDGGVGGGQDWKDGLPDDLKGDASLQDFTDLPALAKAFVETKAMVGKSLRVPGSDAGDEDWTKFHANLMEKVPSLMFKPDASDDDAMKKVYDSLGRPEKSDAYKTPEIDAQGTQLDMTFAEGFKEIAHKNGLNQKQYNGIINQIAADSIKAGQDRQANIDADTKKLSDELGAAFDSTVQIARGVASKMNAPKFLLDPLNSVNPPYSTVLWFKGLADTLGVETSELVKHPSDGTVMTPADAIEKMGEMRRNAEHPLNRPSDPGHKAALEKFTKLAAFAHPAKK